MRQKDGDDDDDDDDDEEEEEADLVDNECARALKCNDVRELAGLAVAVNERQRRLGGLQWRLRCACCDSAGAIDRPVRRHPVMVRVTKAAAMLN